MKDPRQMHGNHTWDLVLHYHECPFCGFILESRDKFEKRFHHIIKDLTCSRCSHPFRVEKKIESHLGPLLGHNPEIME